jgi:EAL domain-containing protein (putative c-di-GMP-specific phosphodiesterase class I)
MARWDSELGPAAPRRISVNASANQLATPAFADTVRTTLADRGLPASRLTVEVTETAVFGGAQAIATLWAIQGLGVRIALDDFGTGQSSLGLLRDCPVDVLKVDKSFVAALTEGGRDSAIVAGLIGIVTGLGLHAVAEGIEDPAQAVLLRQLGYHFGQGYLFGKPMPPGDLSRLLAGGRPALRAPATF